MRSTELGCLRLALGLGQHAHDGLGSGWPDEYPAARRRAAALTSSTRARSSGLSVFVRTRTFCFACGQRGMTAAASASVRPLAARTPQSRSAAASPSPVTWPSRYDHVAGLLAAEETAFPVEGLEHVAVADVGRDHPDAALRHQPVEAEVRHRA